MALVDGSKNVKKQDGKRTTLNDVEVDKASLQDSPVYSGGNPGRNRVKGKVKEFVKMFNQETPSKPNDNIDSRSQSSRWKKKGSYGARNEVSVSSTKTGLEEKIPRAHVNDTVPEASIMVNLIFTWPGTRVLQKILLKLKLKILTFLIIFSGR